MFKHNNNNNDVKIRTENVLLKVGSGPFLKDIFDCFVKILLKSFVIKGDGEELL